MQKGAMVVLDAKGQPLTGVTVTVKIAGTGTLASIFSDNGVTSKSNPFLNDANGSYEFYAANGRYDIELSKTGVTFQGSDTSDLALFDPADAFAGFGAPVYTDELTGLALSNNGTDATNDIDVAAGAAASDDATITNRVLMILASGLTKQLDATWAAGNNAGGRVSGQTLADGTWHVFLFRRAGGQDDICFSNSLSFTTPDSGTHRRRIGSIVRASGAILAFQQEGDLFRWVTKPALDFNTTSGTSANTVTLTVPIGIRVRAFGYILPTTAAGHYFSSLDETDEAPSGTVSPLLVHLATNVGGPWGPIKTNTSGQVRFRSNTNVTTKISTHGWLDRRGRG